MPRKRTISDQALLDTALLIVRSGGPDSLSFGALAAQVGLAGSTIVQRFGTKAALLRAALSRAWDLLDDDTATADRTAPLDPPGAIELLIQLSGQYAPDDDFADQLLLLREDLRDPVLRDRGRAWLTTLSAAVERRIGDGNGGREGLGILIVGHWQGALTIWSFTRESSLRVALRASLEDLFARLGLATN
jgi:AcrR family transcriptional regulator